MAKREFPSSESLNYHIGDFISILSAKIHLYFILELLLELI